jgi:hypothetical protein
MKGKKYEPEFIMFGLSVLETLFYPTVVDHHQKTKKIIEKIKSP